MPDKHPPPERQTLSPASSEANGGTDMTALPTDQGHESHGLVVDEESREVFLAGKFIELTRTEFDLLVILRRNPRRVLTPEFLLSHIWHSEFVDDGHPIEVYVYRLRKKLGESGRRSRYIHTIRGVGYRFEPDSFDNGHIELVFDGHGVLQDVKPQATHLWGVPMTRLLGTTLHHVAGVMNSLVPDVEDRAAVRWAVHVSRPSISSS